MLKIYNIKNKWSAVKYRKTQLSFHYTDFLVTNTSASKQIQTKILKVKYKEAKNRFFLPCFRSEKRCKDRCLRYLWWRGSHLSSHEFWEDPIDSPFFLLSSFFFLGLSSEYETVMRFCILYKGWETERLVSFGMRINKIIILFIIDVNKSNKKLSINFQHVPYHICANVILLLVNCQ